MTVLNTSSAAPVVSNGTVAETLVGLMLYLRSLPFPVPLKPAD
jgi:hypothetical protein